MRIAQRPQVRRFVVYGLLVALAVITSLFLTKNIDFGVYWYAVNGFFDGSRPAYGPASGAEFPMHYRYPPVTYLLLLPLRGTSIYWSGFFWTIGAWIAVTAVVRLAVRILHLRFTRGALIALCAFMLAYVVLSLRSGNVQPYMVAMIFAALLLSESHCAAAASLLALAITFKIWPVFFLPWFARSGRRMVFVWLIPVIALLWLAPLIIWSPSYYIDLIHQWYQGELQTATANSELWYFPGQSLRGVLLRYLTSLDPWIKGFPNIHILSLSPENVIRAWEVIAAGSYLAACFAMLRSDWRKRWVWDGLSFALFSILQPFCLKSSMISLGPAALIAAAKYSITSQAAPSSRHHLGSAALAPRRLFLAASAISFLGAVIQHKPLLRLLLALGIDFYAALLLLAALLFWTASGRYSINHFEGKPAKI